MLCCSFPVYQSCDSLPLIPNSIVESGSNGAGTLRRFTCILPFVLIGSVGAFYCQTSGSWSVSGNCGKHIDSCY